jgi:hypothetical protein
LRCELKTCGIVVLNKKFAWTGAGIFRLKVGTIVAAALETDRLGFLRQVVSLAIS